MKTLEISTAQAKEIAFCIIKDIEGYIKEHQKEYQEFLKKDGMKKQWLII